LDYTFQVVENQHIAMMPSNDDANTIGYETKFLISNEGRYPPIAWNVSKVQPAINGDITRFTMTQEQFDPSRDNAELMIADYYASYVEPDLPAVEEASAIRDWEFVYSGMPTVRAGGGYKKFTLQERIDDLLVDMTEDVEWFVDFPDGDLTKLEFSVDGNVFKVKCLPQYDLIGKTFTVTAQSAYNSKSITVEVISL
jgi:hypothetical protein